MHYAHRLFLDVAQAVEKVDQLAEAGRVELHRQGVDGEVAAVQVQLEAGELHHRQGGRGVVVFQAGGGHVQAEPACLEDDVGGAELLVGAHLHLRVQLPKAAGKGDAVALHHHVQIQVFPPEEQIAHRSAHQIGLEAQLSGRLAHLLEDGHDPPGQALAH